MGTPSSPSLTPHWPDSGVRVILESRVGSDVSSRWFVLRGPFVSSVVTVLPRVGVECEGWVEVSWPTRTSHRRDKEGRDILPLVKDKIRVQSPVTTIVTLSLSLYDTSQGGDEETVINSRHDIHSHTTYSYLRGRVRSQKETIIRPSGTRLETWGTHESRGNTNFVSIIIDEKVRTS